MARISNETRLLGQTLRRLRIYKGYSQKALSEVLGVSFQQIQKYENGKNRLPAEKLHKLKQFYSVPYSVFFEGFESDLCTPEPTHKAQEKLEMICRIIHADA